MKFKEKLLELSSRYYELIPHDNEESIILNAIDNTYLLMEEDIKLYNLINIEKATKILLAAANRIKEINPMDYCVRAMECKIELLSMVNPEGKLLLKYIQNSLLLGEEDGRDGYSQYHKYKIGNIFRLDRKVSNWIYIYIYI